MERPFDRAWIVASRFGEALLVAVSAHAGRPAEEETRQSTEKEPLTLTDRVGRPATREWTVANRLFDHPRGCRCSTCGLVATLAAMIRRDEEINGPRPRLDDGSGPAPRLAPPRTAAPRRVPGRRPADRARFC